MSKTLESMFIDMFEEISKLNMELTLEVDSLKKEIEKLKKQPETEDERNYIYLENKPYYYFSVQTESVYSWNDILLDNNKTPAYVEKALTDEKHLLRLAKLKQKDTSYWHSCIGEVREHTYDYLFKDRKGRSSVITLTDSNTYLHEITNKGTFLDKEKAQEKLIKDLKSDCKYYIDNYKEKFEEVKAKREEKEREAKKQDV